MVYPETSCCLVLPSHGTGRSEPPVRIEGLLRRW